MAKDWNMIEEIEQGYANYVSIKQSSTGKASAQIYDCILTNSVSGETTRVNVDVHL